MPFTRLRKFLPFPSLLNIVHIIKDCEVLYNAFSVSTEMILWLLSLLHGSDVLH